MAFAEKKWRFPSGTGPLVKICGLTRVDNALACASAGADIIGMVFFPGSPRNISLDRAREISQALPEQVLTCGVFVDASADTLLETVSACRLKAVQLHGKESPELVSRLADLNLITIKAFFAARAPGLSRVPDYPDADFCLAEYGKGILPGGNAETWDYGLANGMIPGRRLMIAGGLTPGNVARAVSETGPAAVDASSGVEAAPGLKDVKKVKRFIAAAKSKG